MKFLQMLCLICTVLVVILIFFLLIFISKTLYYTRQAVAIIQKKCDEYAKLGCDLSTSNNKPISDKVPSAIIGGQNVPDGVLPHMAFVLLGNNSCSGSLISEYFIMTAAHCVLKIRKSEVRVILGSVNRNIGTEFRIEEIHLHRKYNPYSPLTLQNDIALLKLDKKVKFDWKTRPICLNTDFESISTTNITASGWGIDNWPKNKIPPKAPALLKMVETFIDGQILTRCVLRFGSYVTTAMICAGHPTEHKSTSKGDSGGPLQIPLENGCPNTYEQIGITSIGDKPSSLEEKEPTLVLYTKVEQKLFWIANIVWLN